MKERLVPRRKINHVQLAGKQLVLMREYKDRGPDDDTVTQSWKVSRMRAGERVQ